MIEQAKLEHHIQKHIIGVLMHQRYARFRDMRPPKTDTNLYSYHLKLLQKNDFVTKTSVGYTLGKNGLLFVDHVSTESLNVRTQPKIITMLVIQNGDGDILLWRRQRQPFLDQWTLPYGKVHIDDTTALAVAQREAKEKLQCETLTLGHAGECYIRVMDRGEVMMSTLVHVFRGETDEIVPTDRLIWARPHKLSQYDLAPAVEEIMTRTFFRDVHFFEEYTVTW